MKKIDFLKQNWVVGIIWSTPEASITMIVLNQTIADLYAKIFIPIFVLIIASAYHLNNWYMEERIDELEKQVDVLQHKK